MRHGFFQHSSNLSTSALKNKNLGKFFSNDFSDEQDHRFEPWEEEDDQESSSSYSDSSCLSDQLAFLQARFQKKVLSFNEELEYWNNLKIDILASGKVKQDAEEEETRTFKQKLIHIFQEIISYFECPDFYLKEMFARTTPNIDKLNSKLESLLTNLNHTQDKSDEEIRKIKLSICNTNIAIINGFQAILNNVNRELNYCLKCFSVTTEVAATVVRYVASAKVPLPKLDFGLLTHYRMALFHMVQKPMEKIYHFIVDSEGIIERSRRILQKQAQGPVLR